MDPLAGDRATHKIWTCEGAVGRSGPHWGAARPAGKARIAAPAVRVSAASVGPGPTADRTGRARVRNDQTFQLFIDPPFDGPTNMARDEALLIQVGRGAAPPSVRLYQWQPATVSLGYFQAFSDFASQPRSVRCRPVVRRLTGGGAIVHDRELTYSVVLPAHHPLLAGGAARLYELVHDAAIDVLRSSGMDVRRVGRSDHHHAQRGPFLCFERRHRCDVVCGPVKVMGSAQRRTRDAVLQHGSLQPNGAAPVDRPVLPEDLIGPFVNALGVRLGTGFQPSSWDAETLALARDLFEKYAADEWTKAR